VGAARGQCVGVCGSAGAGRPACLQHRWPGALAAAGVLPMITPPIYLLPSPLHPHPPACPRRYDQHTKHCPSCSAALRNITAALWALAAAAAAAGGAAVAALASGGLPALAKIGPGCAAAVGLAALIALPLLKLRPKFLGGTEYVHADH
jgi:hypothetical protein